MAPCSGLNAEKFAAVPIRCHPPGVANRSRSERRSDDGGGLSKERIRLSDGGRDADLEAPAGGRACQVAWRTEATLRASLCWYIRWYIWGVAHTLSPFLGVGVAQKHLLLQRLTITWQGALIGGEGGIRTPGTLARTPHFECGAIDHSATSPGPRGEAGERSVAFGRRGE